MKWQDVHTFWFKTCGPDQWFFKKTKKFDDNIRRKYEKVYWEILRGEHADWRKSPRGRLVEIIILDQFARNMFRGSAQAFAGDALALALSQEAIRAGAHKGMSKDERMFLYLPFMHAESKKIQRESIALFASLKDKKLLWYAKDHKKIIDRFGRYPHRNAARGWKSTPAEKAFMLTHKGY